MSDNETPPIQVNQTPVADQAAAAARTIVLVLGAITALAGFVSTRDLAGFIAYVQTSDGLSALGLAITGATFAWGQWKTRHRAKQLAAIVPHVPDEVAVFKGEGK